MLEAVRIWGRHGSATRWMPQQRAARAVESILLCEQPHRSLATQCGCWLVTFTSNQSQTPKYHRLATSVSTRNLGRSLHRLV
ncbi:hypothetical protein VFPPC_15710 [Pochonia chlamydosporia 170]|uniref:Uncharacterized protein n=1 Tax=Pochonia chlamydosporia 170 TaxID=1380566 RepID=A0A179FPX1_METCM|nr:hypothetical protein VFPPC_15710 [Pochonia chlamydosporia 170]OAQ67634.2 hypothetical protein VFPPC_15710 [Pochonia chlamydosporia 170]